jgi:hypothetical protein
MSLDAMNKSAYFIEYKRLMLIFIYCLVTVIAAGMLNTRMDKKDVYFKCLISAGMIQLFFVIMAFLFPEVKTFFNNLTLKYSGSEAIKSTLSKEWLMTWRAYGFAANLFDGFGYVISILITIVFVYGINKKNAKVIGFAIAMLFMPLVNARTGVLLCIVSFVITSCFYLNQKTVVKYLGVTLITIILLIGLFQYLPYGLRDALYRGVNQTITLLTTGESEGVYSVIVGVSQPIPENLLFGVGTMSREITGIVADNGYINCLWYFGVIGCFLLFFAFIVMFFLVYKSSNNTQNKCITVCVMVIFFLYLIKLYSIDSYSNAFTLIIFVCLMEFTNDERCYYMV